MKKSFYVSPKAVLRGVKRAGAVALVSGRLHVAGSHSSPVTLALLRQGIHEINRLTVTK